MEGPVRLPCQRTRSRPSRFRVTPGCRGGGAMDTLSALLVACRFAGQSPFSAPRGCGRAEGGRHPQGPKPRARRRPRARDARPEALLRVRPPGRRAAGTGLGRLSGERSGRTTRGSEGPERAQAVKMPLSRVECAAQGHDHQPYFFLPWVLPGILVSWVFAGQVRWARAPSGRRWSSLATVERPRTAQRRPSFAALA